MQNTTDPNTAFYWLLNILVLLYLVLILIRLTTIFSEFSQELKRLNGEIQRSDEKERSYWIRQRRKLWLSLLPFKAH